MKQLFYALALLFASQAYSNISYINLETVPIQKEDLEFLKANYQYVDHWEMEWPYEINKSKLSKRLVTIHKRLSETFVDNLEQALLIGDISYYLHNLDEDGFFEQAVLFYEKAIELNKSDYRGYWFLANHYAKGGVQVKSVEFFLEAEKRLPVLEPAFFWEDYIFAMVVANMPSHMTYAMDQARNILGEPSEFEKQLGETYRSKIVIPSPDSTYSFQNIWTGTNVIDKVDFISRPLGFKILTDSTWNIRFWDYRDRFSFLAIVPDPITNEKGRSITYTIMFMVKVAKEGEKLDDFINNITSKYPEITKIESPFVNSKSIALEIKNPDMYVDIGGAHMQVIGLERSKPNYAGMLLEKPTNIEHSGGSEPVYYRSNNTLNRFEERIFYAIMLDTCEDIYEGSSSLFDEIIKERTIIE